MPSSSIDINFNEKDIGTKLLRKPKRDKPTAENEIKPKGPLERIFGSQKKVKGHYFTAGANVTTENVRDVLTEPSPFHYPDALDEFAYKVMSSGWRENLRRQELKLKYNTRNSYQSRNQLDLLNRLYVETKDVAAAKTVLDIDPEFYTIVEGRPVQDRFNLQDYILDTREVLKTRIITGFRMDDAMLIEENFLEEQKLINKISDQLQIYVDTFEEFLSHDHATSMELLKESDKEATKAFETYETFREMSKEFGTLKSQVYNLEEKWRNSKMYQKFLYLVAPMHWRKQFDYYHIIQKPDSSSTTSVELKDNQSSVFGKYQVGATGEFPSLDEMIEWFTEDCKNYHEPVLYFKEPWELLKVFRFIEVQNLNSLLHSEEMAVPLENIKDNMIATEAKFDTQINQLQDIIDNLEGEILWEEERARSLEALARELINGEFRKLISDESILNLHIFVEDVYEARVAPNDANLNACEMMKAIEMKYRDYLLELDYLPHDKVGKAETECYAEEARVMKLAEEAGKKVNQIDRIAKRLRRMLEPVYKPTRELKFRTMLHRPEKTEKEIELPLSNEEGQYLSLFTEYCKNSDNIKEYRDAVKDDVMRERADTVGLINFDEITNFGVL